MRKESAMEKKLDQAFEFSKQQTEEILRSTIPLPFALIVSSTPKEGTEGVGIFKIDRENLSINERDGRVLSAVAKSAMYARLAQTELLKKAE